MDDLPALKERLDVFCGLARMPVMLVFVAELLLALELQVLSEQLELLVSGLVLLREHRGRDLFTQCLFRIDHPKLALLPLVGCCFVPALSPQL